MVRARIFLIALTLAMTGGEAIFAGTGDRILLMGDSLMTANRASGHSVAAVLEAALAQDVADRSMPGARYFYKLPISGTAGFRLTEQYRQGNWKWVVLDGGGNDLLFGCGCWKCDRVLDRLVSKDGRKGAIPNFVAKIRKTGAKVIYVGYLRNPGVQTPIKACKAAGNELDRRLTNMAGADAGVTFLPMSDLVPNGDRSFHQNDLIHPSAKGSLAIGTRIVRAMKN